MISSDVEVAIRLCFWGRTNLVSTVGCSIGNNVQANTVNLLMMFFLHHHRPPEVVQAAADSHHLVQFFFVSVNVRDKKVRVQLSFKLIICNSNVETVLKIYVRTFARNYLFVGRAPFLPP